MAEVTFVVSISTVPTMQTQKMQPYWPLQCSQDTCSSREMALFCQFKNIWDVGEKSLVWIWP